MQTQSTEQGELRNELRQDAENLAHTATDRLHDELDARKSPLVNQAKSISSALDRTAAEMGNGQSPAWLKSALEQGARHIQRLADTIETKDSRQIVSSIRQLARDNPGTFLVSCAAAGFAASRILRAETDEVGASTTATPSWGTTQFNSDAPQVPPTSGIGGLT